MQDSQIPQLQTETFNNYTSNLKFSYFLPSDGFTTAYDPENQYIAIGCNDGQRLLYSAKQSIIISQYLIDAIINQVDDPNQIPITCMKWRPQSSSNNNKKVIGVASAEGYFQYLHIPTLKKIFTVEEKDNSILCCDFSPNGEHFATAGKDGNIRVYDQQTKSIATKLGKAQWDSAGHSNRIFSVKFYDNNTIVSGGWDSVVHIWDLRQGKSVKSFYGPHLAGDSIDFKDNSKILVGCYSAKDQIQIWDIRSQKALQIINWDCPKDKSAYVFSARFIHSDEDESAIVAGACGINQVRVFTTSSGNVSKHSTSVRLYDLKHGCYTVDGSYKEKQICFSNAKGGFYVYKYGK